MRPASFCFSEIKSTSILIRYNNCSNTHPLTLYNHSPYFLLYFEVFQVCDDFKVSWSDLFVGIGVCKDFSKESDLGSFISYIKKMIWDYSILPVEVYSFF